MSDFTTDNITRVRAVRRTGGGWIVTFASTNAGMSHQLYVNGRLADAADTPQQRQFITDATSHLRQVVIAAVAIERRWEDFSRLLASELRCPPWVYRPRVVRSHIHAADATLEILGDDAAGGEPATSLFIGLLWPISAPRWAWGQDCFALGGFGYDGFAAEGFGRGAAGAGLFGIGASLADAEAILPVEGTHRLAIHTVLGGVASTAAEVSTAALVPPPPVKAIRAAAYDNVNQLLTIHIERGQP